MVMIRGKEYHPLKYARKTGVIVLGFFIAGSGARELTAFYLGFWIAYYIRNVRLVRVKKNEKGEGTSA